MGRGPRTIQYDPTRSLTLVSRWVRAVQAARGAIHTRATSEAPDGCGTSVPDPTACRSSPATPARPTAQALEVKVYNTIIADAAQGISCPPEFCEVV